MNKMIGLTVGLSMICAYARADEKPAESEAVQILKKVDAAARAVKAVKYHVKGKGTGSIAARAGEIEATVIFTGLVGMAPEKYFCDARVKTPGSKEAKHITVGSDGEEYYLLDHTEKKAYVDIDPAVLGLMGRVPQSLIMIEFLHPTPFQDEIDGKAQKLLSTKTIDGVECYVIEVEYSMNDRKAVWSFGKKDYLPRERLDQFAMPDGSKAGQLKVITNLDVHPRIDDSIFKFKLPKGYTNIDDFAP